MSITEIRTALHEVRDAVEVPAVDRVDLQRRVRAARRRRTTGRAVVATAAAAVVVAGVALVGGVSGRGDRADDGPVAGGSGTAGTVSESVYFVRDGRLTALDPHGVLHDLGEQVDEVVGWTSERVYVLDDQALRVWAVSYAEGTRAASYRQEDSPVTGAVRSAELSGDGRYLGWQGDDGRVHRYDLKAEDEDLALRVGPDETLAAVGADGLLLAGDDRLALRGSGSDVTVPVDDVEASGQLANGHVLVNDSDSMSRLYDVSTGTADLVTELGWSGVLGPYAERIATVVRGPSRGGSWVQVWDGTGSLPVTGMDDAAAEDVRWADETTLLVSGTDADGPGLWSCDIDLACGRLPVDGDIDLG
jgi:hypothetical protein